jgi:SRSO17 transposase
MPEAQNFPAAVACNTRAGTPIDALVRVEGHRWAIEDAFETAKTELGLTHNETRSWYGWHRHVSLVMLAFAMMAVVRQRANSLTSPQKRSDEARLQRWCDGLSRKSAAWPHASTNAGSSLPL